MPETIYLPIPSTAIGVDGGLGVDTVPLGMEGLSKMVDTADLGAGL